MTESRLQQFLRLEAAGGIILCAAAALALLVANSPLSGLYEQLLDLPVAVRVGGLVLAKPLLLWVNDGLMAVFFMLIGLELKREVLDGELSRPANAILPIAAAIGGMALPAFIDLAVTWGDPVAMRGWAIPTATDTAFALGVLAMVGSGAPASLKAFLLGLAIIDDVAAIIIIAAFFTANLVTAALVLAGVGTLALIVLNLAGVTRLAPYMLVGVFVWVCVLKSGVHATLAGVVVGLLVPLRVARGESPLHRLEHALHPWVAFGVMPLFAFANAGLQFSSVRLADLLDPIQLGIVLGLLLGKPIGITCASWLAVHLRLGILPEGANWRHIIGIALLAGIGFTMSLFIGTLAFPGDAYNGDIRLAVLLASVIAGSAAYLTLRGAGVGITPQLSRSDAG